MKNKVKKILAWIFLIVGGVAVIATFLTATSYTQLAVAILLYPLVVFYAVKAFPCKVVVKDSPKARRIKPEPVVEANDSDTFSISNADKRMFLKLIGGVGISLLLLALFNKRSEHALFNNIAGSGGAVMLADPDGKPIDPAQNQPTDGYQIAEIDDNAVTFYGFTNKDGEWFIMRQDTDNGSFRYCKGVADFPDNWVKREVLTYSYYNDIF